MVKGVVRLKMGLMTTSLTFHANFIHVQRVEAKTSSTHTKNLSNAPVPTKQLTSEKSPFLLCARAMLSSHVRLSSGVLAYDRARLYCRSSSISGSFRAHASERWPLKPYEFSSSDPSLQMETLWSGETYRFHVIKTEARILSVLVN